MRPSQWRRQTNIVLLFSTAATGILLMISFFGQMIGNFTITADMPNRQLGISLSESPDMTNPTTRLFANPVEDMFNITEADLPSNIDDIDGSHNGDHYMAYTYYLGNAGEVALQYSMRLAIEQMKLGVDAAIRVRIYENGVPSTYAKLAANGEPEAIAPSVNNTPTTPFYSESEIVYRDDKVLQFGQVNKYTIVLWLEGWDPECVDDIRSGRLRLSLEYKVIRPIEEL